MFLLFPEKVGLQRDLKWPNGKFMVPGVPAIVRKPQARQKEREFGARIYLYRLLGAGNAELNVEGQRLLEQKQPANAQRAASDLQARNYGNSIRRLRLDNHLGLTDNLFLRSQAECKADITTTAQNVFNGLFINDQGVWDWDLGEARLLHNTRWNIDHLARTFHPLPVIVGALAKTGLRIPKTGYPVEAPRSFNNAHPVRKIWALMFPSRQFPDLDQYTRRNRQYINYDPRHHLLWDADRDTLPGDQRWTPVPRHMMPAHMYDPDSSQLAAYGKSTSAIVQLPSRTSGTVRSTPINHDMDNMLQSFLRFDERFRSSPALEHFTGSSIKARRPEQIADEAVRYPNFDVARSFGLPIAQAAYPTRFEPLPERDGPKMMRTLLDSSLHPIQTGLPGIFDPDDRFLFSPSYAPATTKSVAEDEAEDDETSDETDESPVFHQPHQPFS